MITTLLDEAQSNLLWWKQMPVSFKQWLRESHDVEVKQLKNATEPRDLFKAQGSVEVWDKLIDLERTLLKSTKGN